MHTTQQFISDMLSDPSPKSLADSSYHRIRTAERLIWP